MCAHVCEEDDKILDLEELQGYTWGTIFLDFNCIFSSFSGLGLTQCGLGVAELHSFIHHRNVLLTYRYCIQVYLHRGCH